jgi:hypothetical protein
VNLERDNLKRDADSYAGSILIKLNAKEEDMQRMENLILEMHGKMDTLIQERKDAQFEAKESYKATVAAESEL